MSRRLLVVPLGLVLCAVGCGVQDYEAQMNKSQARVERWEAEAKALDAPLVIPSRLGANNKPISFVTVFVRPPRGIPSSPLNAKEPRERLMFTFQPKGKSAAGAFHSVEVAVGDKAKEFPTEVLSCYRPSNTPANRKRVVNPPGRAPVTFNTYEFDDGALFYSVNLWKGDRDQVAVVYAATLAQKAAASRTIDLSLETFATGADALKVREFTLKGPLEVPGHPSQ
ncbi:MAG: hypothetical protein U0797_04235 [Gemmataceae bacterium]